MPIPDTTQSDSARPARHRVPIVVLWICGTCIAIEVVLQLADLGLMGSALWRGLVYQNGAFWPGLLRGWQPNYAAQPVVMFLSYAFLHGGFWHLLGNVIALLVLGRIAVEQVGGTLTALIYAFSAFGGALVYGLMAFGANPMVGASGAIFGLAGAWQYWDFVDPRLTRRRRRNLLRSVGFLVLLNVVFWLLLDGVLAWQTHLGGFLTGWIAAAALFRWRPPRSQ
ncbi:MAG: rhomboid family intramembrane serine protease [Pseudomonadota bacterium]